MKIVTAEEMRAIDRATTEKYGVPSLTLMENAGTAVAEFAQKHFDFNSVCVVCGKGNNGGDGFVAACKLHEAGKKVSAIVLAKEPEELRGDAVEMFKKLSAPVLWVADEKDFAKPEIDQALNSDLILDAILGTGFKPPLKGIAEKAIIRINKATGFVLAIDIPSGVDADLTDPVEPSAVYVHADAIVSFTAAKPAVVFGNLTDGPIAIAPIGSPEKLITVNSHLRQDIITSRDAQAISIPRQPDAHKGIFGHVLVIGGSVGKSGAAVMAGMAALRVGAGLVTVAAPKSVQPLIAASAPELMTEPLPETSEGTISLLALAERERLLKDKSVVVIGPGISRNAETAEFVRDLASVCPCSTVIDADGLNAFEGLVEELQPDKEFTSLPFVRVLTPHPGEMSRLTGVPTGQIQSQRVFMARKLAKETQTCVVLKGHRTVIASPDAQIWINSTGNPGMAKGGSGDVLSGIIAGLLSQPPAQPGWVSWKADWNEETEFGDPLSARVFRYVSREDPGAATIRTLAREFGKTGDTKLQSQLNMLMKDKAQQAVRLINSLVVAGGVFLHGLAGDIAASLYGQQSMIATDIINCLGEAFAVCEAEALSKFVYLQR
ncbi:MAG TPA: NAD(P)H-hydrate dehydratase [Candidatus Angelobacter sp.]|jgi:NAD(P)H-hydrate epimerase|nr:NAD(P)H-hydrate dehydratase [Candidatus Angelobacter sp.]